MYTLVCYKYAPFHWQKTLYALEMYVGKIFIWESPSITPSNIRPPIQSVRLSFWLTILCLFTGLSFLLFPSLCSSVSQAICLSVGMSCCLSVCGSVLLSVCLWVCLVVCLLEEGTTSDEKLKMIVRYQQI